MDARSQEGTRDFLTAMRPKGRFAEDVMRHLNVRYALQRTNQPNLLAADA